MHSTRRKLSDAEQAELDAMQARLDAELAQLQAGLADPLSSANLDEEIVAPITHERVESWDYQNGPLPREWWSAAQEAPTSYEWVYRRISPDEESTVLGMELPEAHDWATLWRNDLVFHQVTFEQLKTARQGDNHIRDLMSLKQGCGPNDVDANLVRAWVFLLGARVMPETALQGIFPPRHFDGIVIPCYASGPSIVRELRWTGGE